MTYGSGVDGAAPYLSSGLWPLTFLLELTLPSVSQLMAELELPQKALAVALMAVTL